MAELEGGILPIDPNEKIEIDMLDFAYVETCKDWKKLAKILDILRSGKEGYYPEVSDIITKEVVILINL